MVAKLKAKILEAAAGSNISVSVSYTQAYALWVHENMKAHHPVGQAKFLEEPARTNAEKYATIVRNALKKGATLAQALTMAGLALQADSQKLVPVDTGALKGSATTRLEYVD